MTANQNTLECTNSDAYDEAAAWLDRLSEGRLDKISAHRFNRWLNVDNNQSVFDRMLQSWSDPGLEQAVKLSYLQTPMPERYRVASKHWQRFWWGSGAALACLLLSLWLLPGFPSERALQQTFATEIAMTRDVNLDDGSLLSLGAHTSLEVVLESRRRRIDLKRGTAYFDVASDKSRPFAVSIGEASVVAVGTEFNVDRTTSGTDVTVYEGAVEVREKAESHPRLVRAGEQVRITSEGISATVAVDLNQLVDWRSGWIEVQDESLMFVLDKLSRHSNRPIRLATPELAELRIAGRFRLKDTDTALSLLSQLYPIQVEQTGERIWIEPSNH